MDSGVFEQLQRVRARFDAITEEMAQPDVAADYERMTTLARERSDLSSVVDLLSGFESATAEAESATAVLANEEDEEMRQFVQDELTQAKERAADFEERLRRALLPKDPRDGRNVIVEIRGGAGGEEAALFAADLFRMYTRYAERHNWGTEMMSASGSEKGGFKEVTFQIRGDEAYSKLKWESGVHRVQRVPETETQGRIHTSTATVAVLPEAEEVDVEVEDKDLRVDIFHASGAGGQNVNKVATAVRLTHIPTGLVVVCQDERSQFKNRIKAMTVLRSRLFDAEQQKRDAELSEARRSQVGTGDRSEKIRTYNFPQDRLTDHRIGLTVHSLVDRLDGNIDDIVDAITTVDETDRLQGFGA